ncbi:PEP carboxykinase-like protein [Rhizopogon salebrosus TDB-379]|nr:PEP carboxykinase-like protein [Rhizopogon salebrosus TDB-379]
MDKGDVTLFFDLSGTGKTTLSTDPNRLLISHDEHVWSDTGVFNIEGGCYAKCINLLREKEPEIFNAIRFGSILENIPRMADRQPSNIIMLTCDAFGVLPPVSKLSPEQASYHFLAGYTSHLKENTCAEDGVLEPIPTFSTCYSAPFVVLHPGCYAEMLADRMSKHNVSCWLINTGWTGGKFGTGKRCPLKYTRCVVDAVHSGELLNSEYETFGVFDLQVPTSVEGVSRELLNPRLAWADKEAFEREVRKLSVIFQKAFKLYEGDVKESVGLAGPRVD